MKTNCLSRFRVRPALQHEITLVSALESDFFQGSSLDAEGLFSWWKSYPKGVYVFFVENNLAGAMSIWPIRNSIFSRLKAGTIAEMEILADDIISSEECRTFSQANWYLASVILAPRYYGKGLSKIFTRLVMHEWVANGNLNEFLELCALAYTTNGARLLTNMGFYQNGNLSGKYSVYTRQTTLSKIRNELIRSA
jgi:hypothetical protein